MEKNTTDKTIMFDVCGDYSLDIRKPPSLKPDLSGYRSFPAFCAGMPVTVWVHIEYDEIHFLSTEHHDGEMLQGMYYA